MEPPVELDELMERIRAAAARPGQPSIPGTLSALITPPVPDAAQERAALELALAEAAALLPKAGKRTAVRASVPKILRPLYRNQGGFNDTVLELFDCLLEVNQQLRRQNLRIQNRLDALETELKRLRGGTA